MDLDRSHWNHGLVKDHRNGLGNCGGYRQVIWATPEGNSLRGLPHISMAFSSRGTEQGPFRLLEAERRSNLCGICHSWKGAFLLLPLWSSCITWGQGELRIPVKFTVQEHRGTRRLRLNHEILELFCFSTHTFPQSQSTPV